MTSQFMQMNINISESAPRRLDCGFTAHAQNICPRTPRSAIQTRQWSEADFCKKFLGYILVIFVVIFLI